jgi:hypothetical protein
MFRQIRKTGRICFRGLSETKHTLVARKLALDAETALDPPQHWIQRKQHETQLLQQVDPVISTPQVFYFMQDNLLQLRA